MGQQVSSGKTSITGSVSANVTTTLPSPSAAQTIKHIDGYGSSNTTVIYTVPANTRFVMLGLVLNNGDSAGTKLVGLTAAGAWVFYGPCIYGQAISLAGGIIVPKMTAGQTLVVSTNCAAGTCNIQVWGYEEAA